MKRRLMKSWFYPSCGYNTVLNILALHPSCILRGLLLCLSLMSIISCTVWSHRVLCILFGDCYSALSVFHIDMLWGAETGGEGFPLHCLRTLPSVHHLLPGSLPHKSKSTDVLGNSLSILNSRSIAFAFFLFLA